MRRISLLHISVGFWLIFFAASFGAFIGLEAESFFLNKQNGFLSWDFLILKSAHTHTNMFGMIHILIGITLPYAKMSVILEKTIFGFIFSGSMAMSLLMVVRSFYLPDRNYSFLMILSGILLSFALLGLLLHSYFLTKKLLIKI